jgi:hypothetical protein
MTNYIELLAESKDWFHAIVRPYTDLLGTPAVVMILGGFYVISLMWYTEDIRPPAVILILYGGVFIFGAPASVAMIFGAVSTVAIAIAYMSIYGIKSRR